LVLGVLPASSAGLQVAELKRETPVDFEKEILPIFRNSCLACHNTTKAKGGLNLETPQLILKGGDTGPSAVPGKSGESLLLKASLQTDPELIMPPKDNKANAPNLTPDQLALVKLWIDQGAKGEVRGTAAINWLEKPPVLEPILAVALTRDGQFAACARGNRIDVYHVPSAQLVTRLADAKLASAGLTNAAHRDVINSLSFNADGTLLASAAFREVKIWRRPRDVRKFAVSLTNTISGFAVSPDRKWIATVGAEHQITIVSTETREQRWTLFGHKDAVTSLKFSPDSARLCSGSADKTVRLWDVTAGTALGSIDVTSEVNAVAWLANGQQIAAGANDGAVRIWSLPSLALVKELKTPDVRVTALEPLADGTNLLAGASDGIVRRWNVAEGKALTELKHDAAITALAVQADGKRFASAGTNKLVRLWNAEDGKVIADLKGDRYAIELAAETERALTVAKQSVEFHDKSVKAAEAESKKQQDRVAVATTTNTFTEKVFLEKEKVFKEAEVAKNTADKALTNLLAEIAKTTEAFESADKAAKEAAARARVASTKAAEAQIAAERTAFSKADAEKTATEMASLATRTKAAVGTVDAAKETAARIAEESASVAEKSRAYADAVAADADMKNKLAEAARAAAEKAIEDVASLSFGAGQLKPSYDKTLTEAPEKRKQATNQIDTTTKALAAAEKEFKRAETRKSVTGHELELALQAAGRASNTVVQGKTVLDGAKAQQQSTESDLEKFRKAAAQVELASRSVSFSPDGDVLATLSADGRVRTWSAKTGVPYDVYPATTNAKAVAFLDDRTVLAAGGAGEVTAWDLQPAWTLERVIGTGDVDSPLADRVNAVRFSPDGTLLATGAGEPTRSGEIKLWNVADGAFVREIPNVHSDAVLALEFSPDGKFLASSSADRFARIVDLASGKVVKAFEGHTSYVLAVGWRAGGRMLVSAGADNVVKVWDTVTGDRKKNVEGAGKEVTSVTFVGVTDQFLAASGDGQVRLLKENGEKVRAFEGAGDFVNGVAATPDGRYVIAGGHDSVLRVWNGNDGKLVANLGSGKE
jgi:WD40 repeat protein